MRRQGGRRRRRGLGRATGARFFRRLGAVLHRSVHLGGDPADPARPVAGPWRVSLLADAACPVHPARPGPGAVLRRAAGVEPARPGPAAFPVRVSQAVAGRRLFCRLRPGGQPPLRRTAARARSHNGRRAGRLWHCPALYRPRPGASAGRQTGPARPGLAGRRNGLSDRRAFSVGHHLRPQPAVSAVPGHGPAVWPGVQAAGRGPGCGVAGG